MANELTESEGIKKGTEIWRVDGSVIRAGAQPGHTTFRASKDTDGRWIVTDKGIVCFCAVKTDPDWLGFEVITVPKTGFFCHVEPFYKE